MALDAAVEAQIAAESRESFALMARGRAAHQEEMATAYSQVGVQQQSIYGALASNMLTGVVNQQANTQQALKSAGYFPTVLPITETPKA